MKLLEGKHMQPDLLFGATRLAGPHQFFGAEKHREKVAISVVL
ncbi:hypothetical protein PY723_15460 [Listeria monocytogenes]|nr:hypothetical protein [Listeria monocytogenes]